MLSVLRNSVILLACGLSATASALTPAFSSITNQAYAEYFDVYRGVPASSVSNVSRIQVKPYPQVSISPERAINATPGAFFNLSHTLINTGNVAGDFELAYLQTTDSDFSARNIQVLQDLNGNGLADSGEPVVNGPISLVPGERFDLVVVGSVPSDIAEDQSSGIELSAFYSNDQQIRSTLVDTISTGQAADVLLSKDSNIACDQAIERSDSLTYKFSLTNRGRGAMATRDITVGDEIINGVLIEDALPRYTNLSETAFSNINPVDLVPLIKLESDQRWQRYQNWNQQGFVSHIAMAIPEQHVQANHSISFDLHLFVDEKTPSGESFSNLAYIDIDGNGSKDYQSNSVCNVSVVDEQFGLSIRFMRMKNQGAEANFVAQSSSERADQIESTGRYSLDNGGEDSSYDVEQNGVWLEVFSSNLNWQRSEKDDYTQENKPTVVELTSSKTGDLLYVHIEETDINTATFISKMPVRLRNKESGGGRLCSPALVENCVLQSEKNDILIARIFDGSRFVQANDSAVVDPYGIVFDSITFQPVAGAVVSLRNPDGSLARDPNTNGTTTLEPQTTGPDGEYNYPEIYPGDYYVDVIPSSPYGFRSLAPEDTFVGRYEVNEFSYGRDGFQDRRDSGIFTLEAGDPPLVIDIPIDNLDVQVGLQLQKSVELNQADLGDLVPYRLRLENSSDAVMVNTHIIDQLPAGFRYKKGSMRLNGQAVEPETIANYILRINIERLAPDEVAEVRYLLEVGPSSKEGTATNTAVAYAESGGGVPAQSTPARASIQIFREGLLSNDGYIIGRVQLDNSCYPDLRLAELSVPGVKIYMDDGRFALTDANGMYSFYGIKPGNHVVAALPSTLPSGTKPKLQRSGQMGFAGSELVHIDHGLMQRVDFSLALPSCQYAKRYKFEIETRRSQFSKAWLIEKVAENAAEQNQRSLADSYQPNKQRNASELSNAMVDKQFSAALDSSLPIKESKLIQETLPNLEQLLPSVTKAMAKAGHWIWPTGDIDRTGGVVVVIRAGIQPNLYINDELVAQSHLGNQMVNQGQKAQILGWYNLSFTEGDNKVEVKGTDPFGNERVLASKVIKKPGVAKRLVLRPTSLKQAADGNQQQHIKLRLVDKNELPVLGLEFASVSVSSGKILNQDIQSNTQGHQVRLVNGEVDLIYQSGYQRGEVELHATIGGNFEATTHIELTMGDTELFAIGSIELGSTFGSARGSLDQNARAIAGSRLDHQSKLFLKGEVIGKHLLTLAYNSTQKNKEKIFRDIDADRYYASYGDASVKGYEAQSSSKLYLQLEKENRRVSWGDFKSNQGRDRSFTTTDQSLTGLTAELNQENHRVFMYAALADYESATETFRANGTATDYRLKHLPVLINSETVRVIVRDRLNPARIITEKALQRYHDYTVDDRTGDLHFFESIASQDEDRNPVFIVVNYKSTKPTEEYLVAGANLSATIGDKNSPKSARLNFNLSHNDSPESGADMAGLLFEKELFDGHDLALELAYMTGTGDDTKELKGYARRAEWNAHWNASLKTSLSYIEVDEGFQNSSSATSAGRTETKLKSDYRTFAGMRWLNELVRSENNANGDFSEGLSSELQLSFGRLTFTPGLRFQRQAFADQEQDSLAYTLRTGYRNTLFSLPYRLIAEGEVDSENTQRYSARLGAEQSVSDYSKIFARYEIQNGIDGLALSDGSERSKTSFGIETRLNESISAYSEYQEQGLISDKELELVSGIRGSFEVVDGLRITPAFEYIHQLDQTDDEYSVSLTVDDRRSQTHRKSVRIEQRKSDDRDYKRLDGLWIEQINDDWSIHTRFDYSLKDEALASNSERLAMLGGFTYRPIHRNDLAVIGSYQLKKEEEYSQPRVVHLLSSHLNYQLDNSWQLAARAAIKHQSLDYESEKYSSSVSLLGADLRYNVTDAVDIGVDGAALVSQDFASEYSLGFSVGYTFQENKRVELSYNVKGFKDRDFDLDKKYERGLRLGFKYKLSDNSFQFLKAKPVAPVVAKAE